MCDQQEELDHVPCTQQQHELAKPVTKWNTNCWVEIEKEGGTVKTVGRDVDLRLNHQRGRM